MREIKYICTVLVSCLVLSQQPFSYADNALDELYELDSSSLVLLNTDNQPILSKQAQRPLIPASTVKLLTALIALEHWGRAHHFKTEFYYHRASNTLIVKGLGDPFLVSEELDKIVDTIKQQGINNLNAVITDTSFFASDLAIAGQGKSDNPYDASLSALAVNFNTVDVRVDTNGITSAEPQTPITPMAKSLAKGLAPGRHRINLGAMQSDINRSAGYFTQVLVAKLELAGVVVQQSAMKSSATPADSQLLFSYSNSHSLESVVTAMLEYSNNFIANQIFLMLGAEKYGPPADLAKSQRMLQAYIDDTFQWQDYVLQEGAGLSRANRLSAAQLIDVLQAYMPYRDLMPRQSEGILAKSGTLQGVSCYAGYLMRQDEWLPFAMLINQAVRYRFREQVAGELLNYAR